MFKNLLIVEVDGSDDRKYRFECPPNSPLGEVYDALSVMRSSVLEQMKEQPKEKESDPQKEEKTED